MARQAGVPVVPVAIKNSDVLMGKGTGESRSGTIEMVFMKPIDTTRLTTDDDIDRLVTDVRAQVANELATGSHD
jgi:1-acyl-sn-glycerol-3-phosphate acyltransferase